VVDILEAFGKLIHGNLGMAYLVWYGKNWPGGGGVLSSASGWCVRETKICNW